MTGVQTCALPIYHWKQRAYLIESVPTLGLDGSALDAAYEAACASVKRMVHDLAQAVKADVAEPPIGDTALEAPPSSMRDGKYQQAVKVAKEHILAGDIFQVVLSQRFDLKLDADPFDFYRVLRQVNPSPYMYFVRHESMTIAGN